MEEQNQNIENQKNYLPFSLILSLVIMAFAWIYTNGLGAPVSRQTAAITKQIGSQTEFEERVLPSNGVELPVVWGDLGRRLAESGVMDQEKFEEIYSQRGGINEEERKLLYGADNGRLKITPENSGFLLNLLWGLGLGNKSEVLEEGPMSDPRYGGAGRFASTGGWTAAVGDAMDHYSAHEFLRLTTEQKALVERVSKNVYRPCCGNSTYFPDCNHGMAMLGLLELMASQGISEAEMYKVALRVNSYWFPDTYLTIAQYFKQKGVAWDVVNPREVLGADFSSALGFQRILSQVQPVQGGGGGGCGL
ncbi:MAG: hypothetical protein HZB99_02370 [Candidatus Harrisonbacteria bacterium]|nr:hypothetical protein [Candidatus Harrisonbacteria bacterium]